MECKLESSGVQGPGQALVIRRVDVLRVHDWARENANLRDYLLARVPMYIGLRTGEISSLRIEDIDFKTRTFKVLDSKQKVMYPLPLDAITLDLILQLIGQRTEGYVFTREVYSRSWSHRFQGKPLSICLIWHTIRKMAVSAGVQDFNPRMFRRYFAADWHLVQKKSLELLRRILRHKSLQYTQIYVNRLCFFEDLQREYDRMTALPFMAEPGQMQKTEAAIALCCRVCPNLPVCKYADQMPSWVTGCKFAPQNMTEPLAPMAHLNEE